MREDLEKQLDGILYNFYLRLKHRETSFEGSFEIALPQIKSSILKAIEAIKTDKIAVFRDPIEVAEVDSYNKALDDYLLSIREVLK